ncbi:MAG: cobalamin-binding protein [Marinospirillum sp.]|uniref:cobalamin-binding protein n=1 Tax=Marinospirillum sp. TaxID=2183934 RepID=UPI0019FAAF21|nr:cobalamin-binding protein [Marinospirillum sp.]MBE0507335.1 cobalamin-binding protein [Marinospirillum sp.]
MTFSIRFTGFLLAWLLIFLTHPAIANSASALTLTDDAGRRVQLPQPAQRLVSLAPHITENLFAIGAGNLLVGVVNYSDYPEAALSLPLVGGYNQLDIEGIVALQPDLVIAWHSGNPLAQVEQLQRLGIPVYFSEPLSFAGLAHGLRQLGHLTGQETTAEQAALSLEAQVKQLQQTYAHQRPVRVFYQVWEQPLMTINHQHIIHEAITLCGGVNVFADIKQLIPRISREAVLEQDPEVILGGGMGEENPVWINNWRRFESMQAVRDNKLYFIPPSLLQRATPRMLQGTEMVCQKLQQARLIYGD